MQQWTTQEDQCLLKLYQQIQVYNRWKQISKKMSEQGYQKNELQCRNRYHNKLNPDLNLDKWSTKEIGKIFRYYDEYGSKWNLIQAFIPGRTQNKIKNMFFSTLKNLLRKLLKYFPENSTKKSMKYISSRDITELYQGRGRFKRFKSLLKKILKQINFEIQIKSLDSVVEIFKQILQHLAQVFSQTEEQTQDISCPKKKKKILTQSVEKNFIQRSDELKKSKNQKLQSDVTQGYENAQMVNCQQIFNGWSMPMVNQPNNFFFVPNPMPGNNFYQENWNSYLMWYYQNISNTANSPDYSIDRS